LHWPFERYACARSGVARSRFATCITQREPPTRIRRHEWAVSLARVVSTSDPQGKR
jgi:hypothetical protein